MFKCTKCDTILDIANWYLCNRKKHYYICNQCLAKTRLPYQKRCKEKVRLCKTKWRQEHKEELKIRDAKYYQKHKEKILLQSKKYYWECREKINKRHKNYNRSKKGRIIMLKTQAKRKRNLGFIPLMDNLFPDEIQVDYHHINNIFVIPIPRQVHKNMLGKNHRVKVNNWIEEIIGSIGVC